MNMVSQTILEDQNDMNNSTNNNNNLNTEQGTISEEQFQNLVSSFQHESLPGLGIIHNIEYTIQVNSYSPKKIKPYNIFEKRLIKLREIVEDLLKLEVIRESSSPFASPGFLVEKKQDDDYRLVIDYREINKLILPDQFPMPSTKMILDRLTSSIIFFQT